MPARPGEKHHLVKLTARDVQEMRERYAQGGISILALACEYDVDEQTCHSALRGRTWKTAGGPAYRPRVRVPGSGTWIVIDGDFHAAVRTQADTGPVWTLEETDD